MNLISKITTKRMKRKHNAIKTKNGIKQMNINGIRKKKAEYMGYKGSTK